MPYLGRSSNFAVRTVFTYTPSAGDTSVSGGDVDGKILHFIDGRYAEVYLNGVKLKLGTDYNTDTADTIAGLTALAANDEIEVVVYDSFNVSDTVSATTGGTFTGAVVFAGGFQGDAGNLTLKDTATADGSSPTLTLQTGDTDIAVDDVLGTIAFQAPDEGAGTDAILVAASIAAVSEGDFSSSNNATSLQFLTAASAAVGTGGGRMTFTSGANLLIKDLDTADGSSPTITLQSGDTDIANNDVLGSINFQAPDEGTGTDAILVAASIQAVSQVDFSSSNNATKLAFMTGLSGTATEKMSLSSAGDLSISGGTFKIIDTELTEASDNFSINIQSGNNDFQVKSGGTIFASFKGSAKDLQLTSGNLVIGTAGKGIDFAAQTPTSVTGASASGAEILDHYEEGTWTPVVAGLSLSAVSANYTRIGDMVHFGFTITMPSTSATTHMKVTGAPFSITTNVFGGSLIFTESATVNSLIIGIASSNEIQFYAPQAAFATYANFSGAIVRVSGAFKTDSA